MLKNLGILIFKLLCKFYAFYFLQPNQYKMLYLDFLPLLRDLKKPPLKWCTKVLRCWFFFILIFESKISIWQNFEPKSRCLTQNSNFFRSFCYGKIFQNRKTLRNFSPIYSIICWWIWKKIKRSYGIVKNLAQKSNFKLFQAVDLCIY